MPKKNQFTVSYTNRDIIERIEALTDYVQKKISKTDTRLVQLEKESEKTKQETKILKEKEISSEKRIFLLETQSKSLGDSLNITSKRSLGVWIYNNPLKFMFYALLAVSMLISDFRSPIIDFFKALIF